MASDRMMEYYYSMGQDCLRAGELDDAVTYFRKAANMGAHEAALEIVVIGQRLEAGDGVPKDEEKASYCYRIGVDHGVTNASLYLGKMYLRGINGAKPNPRKARRSLEHASDLGSTEASALLGQAYDEGTIGKVNPARAFKYYLLAAERGDTDSMLMVGLFYAQGTSVEKDLAAAEMWIRKGRDEGDPDGAETLRGFLSVACAEYVNGTGGVVDEAKAWNMAEEAEELGDKEVFFRLGDAFLHATKLPDHKDKAFEAFKRAAKNKIPGAYAGLGLCYEAGLGVDPDIKTAASFYKKAAEGGSPFGMAHYGFCLANGEGVRKNDKKAMQWLIRAAMAGDAGAVQVLREDYDYELQ